MTEPSMLQLQLSRSCVKHGVSVRLNRSRSSLVEKVACSAPFPRSTTVPESPCLDTCLWNTRSSIVPVKNQCTPLNKNHAEILYMRTKLLAVISPRLRRETNCRVVKSDRQ